MGRHIHEWSVEVEKIPTDAHPIGFVYRIFGLCSCGEHMNYNEIVHRLNQSEYTIQEILSKLLSPDDDIWREVISEPYG